MDERLEHHVRALLGCEDALDALAHARDALTDTGFEIDERPALGALVADRGDGGVVLSGHVDVVPAGDGWTRPPHEATFEDGLVYGRGSTDMRGAVAAMVTAVAGSDAPCRMVLTTDEEVTMAAVRALADEGVVDGRPLVVVGEPTQLRLGVAGKGVAWMRVTVSGSSTHAATPEAGASAAERLVRQVAKVPLGRFGPEHDLLGRATIALTGLSSGDRFNILPSAAEARFDARFPPPLTPDDVIGRVREAMPGAGIELAKEEPAYEASPGASEAARGVLGDAVPSDDIGVPYASEAGHWSPRAPTVLLGPGRIEDAHAPDESVAVEQLERAARLYERLVAGFGRP